MTITEIAIMLLVVALLVGYVWLMGFLVFGLIGATTTLEAFKHGVFLIALSMPSASVVKKS
jgi:hypothetical protein